MRLFSTPIEEHALGRTRVWVKREDLCAEAPYPPLGKLRGLEALISRLQKHGHRTIGCWDTRVSMLGVGLAAAMREVPGGKAIFCYPQLKSAPTPRNAQMARELGAEVVPMRGNHVAICWAQARKLVESRGGVMLPFGLNCREAVDAVAMEARSIPESCISGGTVIVSCGSAVTICGLLKGIRHLQKKVLGLSSGRSVSALYNCVRHYMGSIPPDVEILAAQTAYDHACTEYCPFPSHPNYDRKAWVFLRANISKMTQPILFWNVGA